MWKIKQILFFMLSVFLTACGGGGGGGSAEPAATYPLKAAWIASITSANTSSFTISGTSNTYSVTGAGTDNEAAAVNGTFLNQAALEQVASTVGSISVNANTQAINSATTTYYDSNYKRLGSTGSLDSITDTSPDIATAVSVGATGTLYTGRYFTDSTFTTQIGTFTVDYSIATDTVQNSSLMTLTATMTDLAGNLDQKQINKYHLKTDGTAKLFESNVVSGSVNLTYKYQ